MTIPMLVSTAKTLTAIKNLIKRPTISDAIKSMVKQKTVIAHPSCVVGARPQTETRLRPNQSRFVSIRYAQALSTG